MKDAGYIVSGIRRNEPGLILGIGSNFVSYALEVHLGERFIGNE